MDISKNKKIILDINDNAEVVNISGKKKNERQATAAGRIRMSGECFAAVENAEVTKGDVLSVAQVAGIMGAKKTSELIPLSHLLNPKSCAMEFALFPDTYEIEARCTVRCNGRTGVEMEALTGVSVALLAVYDMCKAIDKRMEIGGIRLLEKMGKRAKNFDMKNEDKRQVWS